MKIFTLGFHIAIIFLLTGLVDSEGCWAATKDVTLLIETKSLSLTILTASNRPIAHFHNISLGRGGVSNIHLAGDETTPLGTFHIAWIKRSSRFRIFFGLDFPTPNDGELAFARGVIDQADYEAILSANLHGTLPPQHTALGGQIGIHGIGEGNLAIQQHVNWTRGCIALSNEDAVALSHWVQVGTKVIIR